MQPQLNLMRKGCDLCGDNCCAEPNPTAGKACKLRLFSYLFVSSTWCTVMSEVIFFSIDRGNYLLLLVIKVGFAMNRKHQK